MLLVRIYFFHTILIFESNTTNKLRAILLLVLSLLLLFFAMSRPQAWFRYRRLLQIKLRALIADYSCVCVCILLLYLFYLFWF